MSFILGIVLGVAALLLFQKYQSKKETMQEDWWTVIGIWPETKERYSLFVQAPTPREAEDLVQWEADQNGAELWVAGVVAGKQDMVDHAYAVFVDPDVKRADWINTEKGRAFGEDPRL